jgi:AsmA protein
MRALKVAGVIVAALMGCAILGVVALLLLVDPNRYRGAIEARVREATGRSFALTGAVKLKFFPWLALDIGKVSLGNPEGFGTAPMLTAEHASVGARILPLLHGELEAGRIALDGLTVVLIRRPNGRSNWETIGRPSPSSDATGGHAVPGMSVAGIDVTGATLVLRDEGKQSVARLRDVEIHCGALGPARASELEFRARLDSGEGTPANPVELRTRAMVDTVRSVATFTKLALSGERSTAHAKPVPFLINAPEIVFDWSKGTLAPAKLDFRFGTLALTAELAGEQLFGARVLHGRVRIAEQSPRTFAPSLGWSVPATRDPAAFSRFAASAGVRINGRSLTLEELDLTLDHSHLRGRVAITDIGVPDLEVALHADTVNLDGYRAALGPAASTDKAAAASPLPVAALSALRAHGSAVFDQMVLAGLTVSDVRILFNAVDGEIRLTPSAKAFGGMIAGEVNLDASHEPPTLRLTGEIRGIDVGAAVKAYAKSDRLSGQVNAAAKLSGSGTMDAALIASLAGTVDVDAKDGAVEGLDLGYEIGRAQALLQGQGPPAHTGPARTPFSVLTSHSRLDHGILATDSLRLETQVLKVSGKGTFRLADQAVDYELTAILQEAPMPLARLRGVEIPIAVTGTVRDYKVRPDLAAIAKGRVRQEIERRKGELGEKLKGVLKDLISH